MEQYISFFIGLIALVNPLGPVPVWVSLTQDNTEEEKKAMVNKIVKYIMILLMVFLFLGKGILMFFGLSMLALKAAGGLVILVIGLNTLMGRPKSRLSPSQQTDAMERDDITFSPMTMPMYVGPGTIALMIAHADQLGYPWASLEALYGYLAMIVSSVLACVAIWFSLRNSRYVVKALGPSGIVGLTRIMAFLLMSIGAQYLINVILEVARQV